MAEEVLSCLSRDGAIVNVSVCAHLLNNLRTIEFSPLFFVWAWPINMTIPVIINS
jgi:hypothetical protein